MSERARLSAVFLPVFFLAVLFSQSAGSFVLPPDPFGFSLENENVSAYSFGPFLRVKSDSRSEIAFRPLFRIKHNSAESAWGLDFIYPFFSYRENPLGFHGGFLFNLISFGASSDIDSLERFFNFYPFVFYRLSSNPERRRFAIVPFYGKFGSGTKFILLPLYLENRSGSGVSRNFLWPFFAFYSGDRKGFRFWPFFGSFEEKNRRTRFFMWPFHFENQKGSGVSYRRTKALFPFYYRFDYLSESHKIYLWPFFQKSEDPKRNLKSLHFPWPFVNFKKSDEETRTRFFPFFEKSEIASVKKTRFFLWPLYSSSEINFTKHKYRKRKFLIIFKIVNETPFDAARKPSLQVDLWPVFSYKRDERQASYFHIFSPIEPFVGSSEKLYGSYSFLWRIFELRKKTGKGFSLSALFGGLLFKRSCEESYFHLLGKMFGYSSDFSGRKIRFLFLPIKISEPSKTLQGCAK